MSRELHPLEYEYQHCGSPIAPGSKPGACTVCSHRRRAFRSGQVGRFPGLPVATGRHWFCGRCEGSGCFKGAGSQVQSNRDRKRCIARGTDRQRLQIAQPGSAGVRNVWHMALRYPPPRVAGLAAGGREREIGGVPDRPRCRFVPRGSEPGDGIAARLVNRLVLVAAPVSAVPVYIFTGTLDEMTGSYPLEQKFPSSAAQFVRIDKKGSLGCLFLYCVRCLA